MIRSTHFAVALVLLALALAGCATSTPPASPPPPGPSPMPFDRAGWMRHPEPGAGSVRSRMEDDLVRHRLRPGMTTEQVRRLIGPPSRKDVPPGRNLDPPAHEGDTAAWVYPTSMVEDENDAMTFELVVLFDRRNRLTRTAMAGE